MTMADRPSDLTRGRQTCNPVTGRRLTSQLNQLAASMRQEDETLWVPMNEQVYADLSRTGPLLANMLQMCINVRYEEEEGGEIDDTPTGSAVKREPETPVVPAATVPPVATVSTPPVIAAPQPPQAARLSKEAIVTIKPEPESSSTPVPLKVSEGARSGDVITISDDEFEAEPVKPPTSHSTSGPPDVVATTSTAAASAEPMELEEDSAGTTPSTPSEGAGSSTTAATVQPSRSEPRRDDDNGGMES